MEIPFTFSFLQQEKPKGGTRLVSDLDIRENFPSLGLEAVASLSLKAPNITLEKLHWGAREGDGAPSWP